MKVEIVRAQFSKNFDRSSWRLMVIWLGPGTGHLSARLVNYFFSQMNCVIFMNTQML